MPTDAMVQSFLTLFVVVDPIHMVSLRTSGNRGRKSKRHAAEWLFRLLGQTGVNVVTRILGILLAALAVQYIADGAKGLWI